MPKTSLKPISALLALGLPLCALQAAPGAGRGAAPQQADRAAQAGRLTVAVLEPFANKQVDAAHQRTLRSALEEAVSTGPGPAGLSYGAVNRARLDKAFADDKRLRNSLVGGVPDEKSVKTIGGATGADFVLAADLYKDGAYYNITCWLIDTATGDTKTANGFMENGAPQEIHAAAAGLVAKLLGQAGAPKNAVADEAAAEAAKAAATAAARAAAEEAAKKAADEAALMAATAAARAAADEAAKKAADEAALMAATAAARAAADEAAKKAADEAALMAATAAARAAAEEAAKKTAEEAAKKAPEEAARTADEEATRMAAEEVARAAAEIESMAAAEAAKKAAEEAELMAAAAKAAEEEAARMAAAAAEEAARAAAEEAARVAAEEAARVAAEEAARMAAEAAARAAAAEAAARAAALAAARESIERLSPLFTFEKREWPATAANRELAQLADRQRQAVIAKRSETEHTLVAEIAGGRLRAVSKYAYRGEANRLSHNKITVTAGGESRSARLMPTKSVTSAGASVGTEEAELSDAAVLRLIARATGLVKLQIENEAGFFKSFAMSPAAQSAIAQTVELCDAMELVSKE